MLKKLTIRNVALIKSLELEFSGQLNILSGETGAGKSIIVDSLMLLLGARYDKTLLRFGQKSGFVEGVFEATEKSGAVMEELGFETDDLLIVTRKFFDDGKNDVRINGRTATTGMLKQLTAVLVDIYGQNEYQSLARQSEHLRILDYFVRQEAEPFKRELKTLFSEYKEAVRGLDELGEKDERARNIDLLRYQLEEIEKANVGRDEEETLLGLRKKIAASERINAALSTVSEALSDREDAETAQESVDYALKALGTVSDLSPAYNELYERLNSVSIELGDIADSARDEIDRLNFDFDDLDKLEKRLDTLRSLKRKYGDYNKMTAYKKQSEELLYKLENCTEIYEKLSAEKEKLAARLYDLSVRLHEVRQSGAERFEKLLIAELDGLGMADSEFAVRFEAFPPKDECADRLSPNGMDRAEFYLSPNRGQPLKPLVRIISGGEMSRFMLALKVVSSRTDDIPTMIFDEIDTGISGKIGQEVAKKLAAISRRHQILCVTHLPQIASMADNHYYIVKQTSEGETTTSVALLDRGEMIEEISRLSGAKDISTQSSLNAKQMKEWSDAFKSAL